MALERIQSKFNVSQVKRAIQLTNDEVKKSQKEERNKVVMKTANEECF